MGCLDVSPALGPTAARVPFSNKPPLDPAWLQPRVQGKTHSLEGSMRPLTVRSCSGEPRPSHTLRCTAQPVLQPSRPSFCPIWTLIDLSDRAHGHSKPGHCPREPLPCLGLQLRRHGSCQFLVSSLLWGLPSLPQLLRAMGHVSFFWGLCPPPVHSGL